jgi:hypothetical protein
MRRLTASEIKETNLLKHYRIIRRWACRNNDLNDADLELIIYLECLEYFTKHDFKMGVYSYSWDNNRWNRLLKEGWIVVWRKRNQTTQKYHIYKISLKGKSLINRIYRIMANEENIPTNPKSNLIMKGRTYTDKVLKTSIDILNKDKNR